MRTTHLALIALGLLAAGLAGCGKFQKAQRAAWRDQAEAACLSSRQVQLSSYVSLRGKPIAGPGTCGMEKPLRVTALAGGSVNLTSAATLACPVVATTDAWLAEVVQPAAMAILGAQVLEIRAGSYSCRAMNNGTGTRRTSEHAFGNAVDVFSFRLSDGRNVTVKEGWRGAPEEQSFLREVFVGACERFSTVLGPGADMFHYDHFHIDLARHAKGRRICKPVIKHTPRPDLPPPDPARNLMAHAPLPPAVAATAAPGGGLLRRPGDGLRPPGGIAGGYPVAHHGGSATLDLQRRAIEATGQPLLNAPRYNRPAELPPSLAHGPLRLPGSTPPTEEVIVGDEEGNGVLDVDGRDQGEIVTPQNDPFAYTGSLPRQRR